jgi:hypothetical protein
MKNNGNKAVEVDRVANVGEGPKANPKNASKPK